MNVALRRPLRGSKATLTPATESAGHMSAFHKMCRLKSLPQASELCHGLKNVFFPIAVWDVEGRLWRSAWPQVLQPRWLSDGAFQPDNTHIISLPLLIHKPTHTVSTLWPHSSHWINSHYRRIILVCLAIKYAHVWLFRAARQGFISVSPSLI